MSSQLRTLVSESSFPRLLANKEYFIMLFTMILQETDVSNY